jgi:hypothetical protein
VRARVFFFQVLNDKDFDQLKEDLLWEGSPVAALSRDENQYLIAMQVRFTGPWHARWLLLCACARRAARSRIVAARTSFLILSSLNFLSQMNSKPFPLTVPGFPEGRAGDA